MNGPELPPRTVRAEWTGAIRRAFEGRPSWGECLLHYTGLLDGVRRTLQEIADDGEEYGFKRAVTRERVRQVLEMARTRLSRWAPDRGWPAYEATVDRMRSILPCSPGRFVEVFGYPDAPKPARLFQQLAEIAGSFHLDFNYYLASPPSFGPVVVDGAERPNIESLWNLNKLVGSLFGDVETTARELGCSQWLLSSSINASDRWEFLDDRQWYFWKRPALPPPRPNVTGNKILTVLCILFAAGERAYSGDLEMSIVRHRSLRTEHVPAQVIELIARRSGLFEVEDSEIRRGTRWAWSHVSERDQLLLDIFARHGSVVSSRVLYADLVRGGLSKENANITVALSPFLIHAQSGVGFKEGLYRCVMTQEPRREQAGAAAESAQAVRVSVTARAAATGRVYGDGNFGCDGSWVVRSGKDLLSGRVEISGRMIDGLRPVIAALGLRKGDVLEMRPGGGDGVLVVQDGGAGASSPAVGTMDDRVEPTSDEAD